MRSMTDSAYILGEFLVSTLHLKKIIVRPVFFIICFKGGNCQDAMSGF